MLLTTGIIALSRKVADDRAKNREAKQGLLNVGEGDVAKWASATAQIGSDDESKDVLAFPSSISMAADVVPPSQSPAGDIHRQSVRQRSLQSSRSPDQDCPPPYSPTILHPKPQTTPSLVALSLAESAESAEIETRSPESATIMPDPDGVERLRVHTKGSDLKSGFPYHPGLFDLRVRPEQWERFTAQVLESTKFSFGDNAKMVAAATATALAGAVVTSVLVGRSVNRSLQEKKVKGGLQDMADGGLGDILKQWNETEFRELGISVHLELSHSAIKHHDQGGGRPFRKPSLLYSKREDRERKQEERKFCLVVTNLNGETTPTNVIHELADESRIVEAPGQESTLSQISELPVDSPVELPAGLEKDGCYNLPLGYAELESPVVRSAGTLASLDDAIDPDEHPRPAPLMLTARTYEELNKEIL